MEADYNARFVEWVQSLYGPTRKHRNAHQLAMAVSGNPNLLRGIEIRGRASPDIVVRLARAADAHPIEGLVALGLLTPDEADASQFKECTVEERRLLRLFREMRPDLRRVGTRLVDALWEQSQDAKEPAGAG